VLVNAIYPVIYTTAGTFQSSTHDADTRLRTDFKIVANFANPTLNAGIADIYMKNVGSQRISFEEITNKSDVFCGSTVGNLLTYDYINPPNLDPPKPGYWKADILPTDNLNPTFWDNGETLHVKVNTLGTVGVIAPGDTVYFQLALPSGIYRSNDFLAS